MPDPARRDGYAYAAVNVSSSATLNLALAGFANVRSDGIVQLTPSDGEFTGGIKTPACGEPAAARGNASLSTRLRPAALVRGA